VALASDPLGLAKPSGSILLNRGGEVPPSLPQDEPVVSQVIVAVADGNVEGAAAGFPDTIEPANTKGVVRGGSDAIDRSRWHGQFIMGDKAVGTG
jgi:hypothetical protein